jgi:hypothetical protein
VSTADDILLEMGAQADDAVFLDPLEDVLIPAVTDEMIGAAEGWHARYHCSVPDCVGFLQVVGTQTDAVSSAIRAWPDVLARELMHQVLQNGPFLDQFDALDRFVDKAWAVRQEATFDGVESVNSIYDTLAAWMDDFQHMLTVPAEMELPTLFQSFDELEGRGDSGISASRRLRVLSQWMDSFEAAHGAPSSAAGVDAPWSTCSTQAVPSLPRPFTSPHEFCGLCLCLAGLGSEAMPCQVSFMSDGGIGHPFLRNSRKGCPDAVGSGGQHPRGATPSEARL